MWSECWIKLKLFPYQRCFYVGWSVCVFMLMGTHTGVFVTRHWVAPIPRSPPGSGEHLQPSLFHMPRASQSHSIINSGWLWINKPPSLFSLSDQPDFSSLLWFLHLKKALCRQNCLMWTVWHDDAADTFAIVLLLFGDSQSGFRDWKDGV